MPQYNILATSDEATVVTEYSPLPCPTDACGDEAALEAAFVSMLESQGYARFTAHAESDLVDNLRAQLERLNSIAFSDDEWARFFREAIANGNDGIIEKTRKIQEDNIQPLRRDDGSTE